MKEIIKVEPRTQKVDPVNCNTELLVVGHFSDAKGLDKTNKALDGKLDGAIGRLIELGDFTGKEGSNTIVYGNGDIGAKRVLVVGLGEKKKAKLDTVRKASAGAAKKAVEMKVKNIAFSLHKAFGGRFDTEKMAQAITEGVYFGSYRYDEFITENEDGRLGSLAVNLIDSDSAKIKKLDKGLSNGAIIGKAQSYARTLANRPGNVINPSSLAAEAKKMARTTSGLSCTVLDEKQLAEKKMGGILAVGSGSVNKPRFIVLKYTPKSGVQKDKPIIGLVGKAITFDSGGISIKPSQGLQEMKFDKSGGIAVLATMKAIAELKLSLTVCGIIPAAENMPGGTSYRPGDIITTFSGKTVEIHSTDAEGRMILCDGLSYAVKQKCDIIIDAATLTGACKVALGSHKAGLMGNDGGLIKQLQKAAEESGEDVWHMPSGDEYAEEMKSKIADLKNVGGKWGGACTGAAFLRQFVGDKKWAHLDIAGMEMFEKATGHATEGSSGFGVRLLTTYLMNTANRSKAKRSSK
jgi:leucyl aminopeptidase